MQPNTLFRGGNGVQSTGGGDGRGTMLRFEAKTECNDPAEEAGGDTMLRFRAENKAQRSGGGDGQGTMLRFRAENGAQRSENEGGQGHDAPFRGGTAPDGHGCRATQAGSTAQPRHSGHHIPNTAQPPVAQPPAPPDRLGRSGPSETAPPTKPHSHPTAAQPRPSGSCGHRGTAHNRAAPTAQPPASRTTPAGSTPLPRPAGSTHGAKKERIRRGSALFDKRSVED